MKPPVMPTRSIHANSAAPLGVLRQSPDATRRAHRGAPFKERRALRAAAVGAGGRARDRQPLDAPAVALDELEERQELVLFEARICHHHHRHHHHRRHHHHHQPGARLQTPDLRRTTRARTPRARTPSRSVALGQSGSVRRACRSPTHSRLASRPLHRARTHHTPPHTTTHHLGPRRRTGGALAGVRDQKGTVGSAATRRRTLAQLVEDEDEERAIYTTLRSIPFHWRSSSRTRSVHCITLHYITLHCIALHCIALHCIPLPYIALHCTAFHRTTTVRVT